MGLLTLRRSVLLIVAGFGVALLAVLVASAAGATPPQPHVPGGQVVRIQTGVPGGATVMGNLTVTSTQANGFLTAFPCDQPRPNASNGNYRPLQSVATFVTLKTDQSGAFCVYTSATAHVIFDQVASTSALATSAPQRLLDTRGVNNSNSPPAAGQVIRVDTGSANSVALGTLTVTGGTATGFLTAFECGTPRPGTSNLNFPPMTSVANFVMTRTDATGGLCIYTTTEAHIIYDHVGSADTVTFGVAAAPQRLLDSRLPEFGGSLVPANSSIRVPTGRSNATVFGNLTVTGTQGSGYITVFPCGQDRPTTSNINYVVGQTVANLAGVRTDDSGDFCLHTTTTTHVVFDEFAFSETVRGEDPVRKADSRTDWLGASQIITVSVDSATTQWHRMQLWQRGDDGRFSPVGGLKYGWVGEAGVGQANSWTARTPAGVHTLTQSFGIKSNPGTRLPYFQVDQYDWWNGDSTSPGYNTRYRGVTGPPNSEHLITYGKAYWYSVVIDYNIERIPYAGAAFFLHVATGEPTGGCVSVSERDMIEIMRWLDPAMAPVISIGVTSEATAIVQAANT